MMCDELATEVLENVKCRMQGMWPRIYKVRAWVNPTGSGEDHLYTYHDVFLTESAARRQYKIQVDELESWNNMSNVSSCIAELFIPHVFDDGSLAYWPDMDNPETLENKGYIERCTW